MKLFFARIDGYSYSGVVRAESREHAIEILENLETVDGRLVFPNLRNVETEELTAEGEAGVIAS